MQTRKQTPIESRKQLEFVRYKPSTHQLKIRYVHLMDKDPIYVLFWIKHRKKSSKAYSLCYTD